MKNFIFGILGTVFLAGIFAFPVPANAADLDPLLNEGIKLLQIGNFTDTPGSTNWQNNSIGADAGEVLIFLVHYHNFTPNDPAANTRIRAFVPSGTSTVHTISANIWADNAQLISDSVNANLSSAQTLSFVSGSVLRYHAGGSGIPLGLTGDAIISPNGLNIGDVLYGEQNSGYLTFKVQVSGQPSTPPGSPGEPPRVITLSQRDVTNISATLRGSVDPNNFATEAWFEWGRSEDGLVFTTPRQTMGSGDTSINFLAGITGLDPATVYYYRPVGENQNGITYGSTRNFITSGTTTVPPGGVGGAPISSCLPIVTTRPASFITSESATLRGLINPNGRSTSGWFEYGKSYALTHRTVSQHVGSGSVDTDLLKFLGDLDANSTYYFRAIAENNCGRVQGSILTFTTDIGEGRVPEAITLPATGITRISAFINGKVNPNNSDTTAWFEWGTNPALNAFAVTSSFNLGSGSEQKPVSAQPHSLAQNTTYYYRVVAKNSFGTSRGLIMSFATLGAGVQPPVSPVSGVSFSVWKETKNLTFPNGTIYVNSAAIGDTLEFSLNIKNKGASTLSNISVSDILSEHFEFVGAEPEARYDSSGNSLSWKINSIAPNGTRTITYKVKAGVVEESVVVLNSFKSEAGGATRISNETTTILNPTLMALDLDTDKNDVKKNETFTYTIRYKNIGIADVDNAVIQLSLPKNVSLRDSRPRASQADENVVFFKIGEIGKNESGSIEVKVRVEDSAGAGEKLIATAVLEFADTFGEPQPNISVSKTVSVEGGFFGLASAIALALSGRDILVYLILFVLAAFVGTILYIRHKVDKILKA